MSTNIITFKKIKVPIIRPAQGVIGGTAYDFQWRLYVNGKRIRDTYVKSKEIDIRMPIIRMPMLFQCVCEGVPLSTPMGKGVNTNVLVINAYFELIDAKKALVDYFNQNYEE